MYSQDSFRDSYSEFLFGMFSGLRKRAMSLRDLLCERERVSASILANLSPTHKGCRKAAWHLTKFDEMIRKLFPLTTKKDNTISPLDGASGSVDFKHPSGIVFFPIKREGFVKFRRFFRRSGAATQLPFHKLAWMGCLHTKPWRLMKHKPLKRVPSVFVIQN